MTEGARMGGKGMRSKFESRNLDKIEAFFRPSTLKTEIFSNKFQGYAMCAKRNRLIPFSIWVVGGRRAPPPHLSWIMGRENQQ